MIAPNEHTASQPLRPWLFLGVTLGLTWLVEFLGAASVPIAPAWAVTTLHYLGGAMPLLVILFLLFTRHDRAYRRDFWVRLTDPWRISWRWWGVVLLFVPLKSGLAALIDLALGGWGMAPEEITRLLAQPLTILPTLFFWLIFGPLPEEPGWRGYALDGLQAKYGALVSSLIVGTVWTLWHLPLFFIPGTWQAEVVVLGSVQFWLYMLALPIESVIYTWIFNHTRRSILAAVIFHFMTNSFGQLFALSSRAEVFNFALLVLSVVLVVLICGPKRLRREGVKVCPHV
jgi:uncharacterized protein